MFIGMDPPRHDRLKMLFQAGFTPERIAAHEPAIRAIVVDVLDRLDGREECDLVTEVAQPVVSRVIGSFMGIPPEDRRVLPAAGEALRRRHRQAAARQGVVLQQHQRHRRGLRMRRRVRSQARAGLRDRQARQPVWRRGRQESGRGLQKSIGLRPDLGLRRHRRAQRQARCARRQKPSPRFSPR